MHPRERLAFSPIEGRLPLRFPDGIRLVVWPVFSLEDWDLSRPMARMVITPPQGAPQLPDLPNWSWHEYGMRVAFWRLRRMFERVGARPTVAINAKICETYAPVVKACMDSGWELNAHSYEQIPMHKLEDQRGIIFKTMDVIEKFSGKRPRGWFGPGLTQTFDTLDYLAEAGVEYIGDYVLDDDPVTLKTKHGPIVALPYTFRGARHCHDEPAAPRLRGVPRARHGPVPLSLCGIGRAGEDHGHLVPPLSLRRAAPHRPRRARLLRHPRPRGRGGVDGGGDPGLVQG
jgi:hypothetical protein